MKKLILFLIFSFSAAAQVPLGGHVYVPSTTDSTLGQASVVFTSDANCTIVSATNCTVSGGQSGPYVGTLLVTSGITLTTTRNLVVVLSPGRGYVVENSTTGGQSIQVIGSTGTGVTIPNGNEAIVQSDGTNYFALSGLCISGCVLTNPSGSQIITQPINTNFTVLGSGTGVVDFSGFPQFKLPVVAGYTPTASGECGHDSTSHNFLCYDNGVPNYIALFPTATPPTSGDIVEFLKTGNTWTLTDAGGSLSSYLPLAGGTGTGAWNNTYNGTHTWAGSLNLAVITATGIYSTTALQTQGPEGISFNNPFAPLGYTSEDWNPNSTPLNCMGAVPTENEFCHNSDSTNPSDWMPGNVYFGTFSASATAGANDVGGLATFSRPIIYSGTADGQDITEWGKYTSTTVATPFYVCPQSWTNGTVVSNVVTNGTTTITSATAVWVNSATIVLSGVNYGSQVFVTTIVSHSGTSAVLAAAPPLALTGVTAAIGVTTGTLNWGRTTACNTTTGVAFTVTPAGTSITANAVTLSNGVTIVINQSAEVDSGFLTAGFEWPTQRMVGNIYFQGLENGGYYYAQNSFNTTSGGLGNTTPLLTWAANNFYPGSDGPDAFGIKNAAQSTYLLNVDTRYGVCVGTGCSTTGLSSGVPFTVVGAGSDTYATINGGATSVHSGLILSSSTNYQDWRSISGTACFDTGSVNCVLTWNQAGAASAGFSFASPILTNNTLVATSALPSCATGTLLQRRAVNDATSAVPGAAPIGSGTYSVPVVCTYNTTGPAYAWLID